MTDLYRWHNLKDMSEDEREPEIVIFSETFNCSEAVEVTDGYGIYDTAMIIENHVQGDCNKVYERYWYFGEGGKWEEMGNIKAWRYIQPFRDEFEEKE